MPHDWNSVTGTWYRCINCGALSGVSKHRTPDVLISISTDGTMVPVPEQFSVYQDKTDTNQYTCEEATVLRIMSK